MAPAWHLLIVESPSRAQSGMRYPLLEGAYRVLGRAVSAADATVQLTVDGARALDPDRMQLVTRATGGQAVRSRLTRRGPDVELQDDGVSRTHAMVFVDTRGAVSVVDLMSTNGTEVNGQHVQDADLDPGDVIRIGGTTLRLERG
ncbi:MAG: FHA domain-containing protein [Deltaproteobacteria bacterium]|nr:FHA domain-containing protein [Deltaproteobacteria bacterium]